MNTTTSILPQAAASSGSTSTDGSGLPSSQGLNNMFLQLLIAQLQNDNPLDAMDPTQFVGQLAQFSELSEVTQIDQLLQQIVPGSGSTADNSRATSHPTVPSNTAGPVVPGAITSSAVSAAQAAIPNSGPTAPSILNHQIQGVF